MIMESLGLKKEKIIKDTTNLFRQEKETKVIQDRILRRIFLSMKKKQNYYKLVRVSNFWSNNYIEYKINGDRNKALSVNEYLMGKEANLLNDDYLHLLGAENGFFKDTFSFNYDFIFYNCKTSSLRRIT